jgi:hypothetical protein
MSGQFTAAVLNKQPSPFSWWSGGHLASETNVNTHLRAHKRTNNRSGLFSVLLSTSVIGSSLPASSFSHND